jgi:tetratricopeptide (TPR) repeat protein
MSARRNGWPRLRWWHGLLALAVLFLLGGLAWPWSASAYYVERAGRALASGRAGPQVERQLDRALRWDPHNAQAYRLRAQLYERQGKRIAATEALAGYVALRPANPQGLWALATACEELSALELAGVAGQPCGRDDEGRQAVLARLWQSAGYSAATLAEGGEELLRDGKLEEAEVFYRRALVLNPEEPSAWYGLGEVREARGQREAALEAYGRAAAAGTDDRVAARGHYRRGQILAASGQWVGAAAELALAVVLMPKQGEYRVEYGWTLYRAGEPVAVAIAQLKIAAGLNPSNPWPHVYLARIAFAEQDCDAMLAQAEDAVAAQPGQAAGWLLQGQALDRLGRLAEAEVALHRALELAPENAATHDALGHVLAQEGDLAAAVAAYERAVTLVPQNTAYLLRLANTYRANGQTDQARETYRRVLELEPGNPTATRALEGMAP